MHCFVHGVDREGVDARLEALAERHWAYMAGYADQLVARGPTLSADGTHHTGSVHMLSTRTIQDARRFASEDPYRLANVYASLTVTRMCPVRDGTMWERPSPSAHPGSALLLAKWPARPRSQAAEAGEERRMVTTLAKLDLMVFGGLLTSDDGSHSIGLVAAVDADIARAAALVAGVGLPGSTTSVTSFGWRRGGRPPT